MLASIFEVVLVSRFLAAIEVLCVEAGGSLSTDTPSGRTRSLKRLVKVRSLLRELSQQVSRRLPEPVVSGSRGQDG